MCEIGKDFHQMSEHAEQIRYLYSRTTVPGRPLLSQYPVSEQVSVQPIALGFPPKRETMKNVQSWPEALKPPVLEALNMFESPAMIPSLT